MGGMGKRKWWAKSYSFIYLTSRKSTKQRIITSQSKEERVKNCYNHFHDLIGKEAIVECNLQNTEKPKVHDGLLKKNDNFSLKKF